jgi:hypothetical protein
VRGDLRFEAEADCLDDGDVVSPDPPLDPDVLLPDDEVESAPEDVEPDRTLVTDSVTDSVVAEPELTLPVASFTLPVTASVVSFTAPVKSSVASTPLPMASVISPVWVVTVGTVEFSVSAGSSWIPAAALPDSPPKTSETKSRMRIAADAILRWGYPRSVGLNRPESGETYETAASPSSDLTSAKKSGSGRTR